MSALIAEQKILFQKRSVKMWVIWPTHFLIDHIVVFVIKDWKKSIAIKVLLVRPRFVSISPRARRSYVLLSVGEIWKNLVLTSSTFYCREYRSITCPKSYLVLAVPLETVGLASWPQVMTCPVVWSGSQYHTPHNTADQREVFLMASVGWNETKNKIFFWLAFLDGFSLVWVLCIRKNRERNISPFFSLGGVHHAQIL